MFLTSAQKRKIEVSSTKSLPSPIKIIRNVQVNGEYIDCCNSRSVAERIDEIEIDDKRYYRIRGRCGQCRRLNTRGEEVKHL